MKCNTIHCKVMGDFRPPFLSVLPDFSMLYECHVIHMDILTEAIISTAHIGWYSANISHTATIWRDGFDTPPPAWVFGYWYHITSFEGDSVFVSKLAVVFEFRCCCHKVFNLIRFFFDCNIYFYVTQYIRIACNTICVYAIVCAPVSVWKCVAMRHPVSIFHGLVLKQGQCNTIQYKQKRGGFRLPSFGY